jgi:hypothetical protein
MNNFQWVKALSTMRKKSYWNKANTVEFFGFFVKAIIILPGLVFGVEIWWLYIFAFISSISIVWSSTVKTIPTLIWFNLVWALVAFLVIVRHLV